MIGVVVPAHNEATLVADCLKSVLRSAAHADLNGEHVEVLVVLDDCSDETESIVSRSSVGRLCIQARSVGAARAAGAAALLSHGARWLAFTDADTCVADDWLVQQLNQDAEVVCGTVSVDDWSEHGPLADFMRRHFRRTYSDVDGHRHIHGANLGVSARAYRLVGGFPHLPSSEDVAFVNALQEAGVRIAWSAAPRVVTSARRMGRAPGGFAGALRAAIEAPKLPVCGSVGNT